jgi:hypothetical protein
MSNAKLRKKYTMKHFEDQDGKCWICALPMEPVKPLGALTNPDRHRPFEATLDHAEQKHRGTLPGGRRKNGGIGSRGLKTFGQLTSAGHEFYKPNGADF